MDKNYAGNNGLSAIIGAIKSSLNSKVDKAYGKDIVNPDVENMICTESTDGTYVLKATVSSGTVTYSWEPE